MHVLPMFNASVELGGRTISANLTAKHSLLRTAFICSCFCLKSLRCSIVQVLSMVNASVELGGRTIIRDFDYDFEPGARLGIVGANGSGK